MNGYHSKDEVEEQVDHENVEDILQRVDDAVEHGLQLGHTLDRLERSQHPQHPQGLHGAEVLSSGTPTIKNLWNSPQQQLDSSDLQHIHGEGSDGAGHDQHVHDIPQLS